MCDTRGTNALFVAPKFEVSKFLQGVLENGASGTGQLGSL